MRDYFKLIEVITWVASLVSVLIWENRTFAGAPLLERFKSQDKALNSYYEEYSRAGRPKGQQLEDLKNRIMKPAQEEIVKSIETEKKEQSSKLSEASKKREEETKSKLTKKIETVDAADGQREKMRDVLKNVLKGDLKEINITKDKVTKAGPVKQQIPQVSNKKTFYPAVEPVVLDGAQIPKEIEFPGEKKPARIKSK